MRVCAVPSAASLRAAATPVLQGMSNSRTVAGRPAATSAALHEPQWANTV
jgi:hypothetical protein